MSDRRPPEVAPEEAVKVVESGNRVYVQGVAATPTRLMRALLARDDLRNVECVHIHTEGPADWADPKYAGRFRSKSFFTGANVRKSVQAGTASFVPVFLSEIPSLFQRGVLPIDVAIVSVSPPDRHGWCTLGPSVDVTMTALECAKVAIAQVNPNMPRTHGAGVVHMSSFHAVTHVNDPLYGREIKPLTPEEAEIGRRCAELIDDGSCLQMGIGAIPDAVLSQLGNHRRLGIHTEMFSDGVIPLVESGVVTGEEKRWMRDTVVSSFALGTPALYKFMDDNPIVKMMRVDEVNDPRIIMQNPRVHAINSCIEIDLTGQVCADSIGPKIFSGVGGQIDFMRGAALSEGGKPIIACTSTTAKGVSRIVPLLKLGAGVVTTRSHVHWVVTEWGAVDLFGKDLHERQKLLISVAHPDHRESLERVAKEILPLL